MLFIDLKCLLNFTGRPGRLVRGHFVLFLTQFRPGQRPVKSIILITFRIACTKYHRPYAVSKNSIKDLFLSKVSFFLGTFESRQVLSAWLFSNLKKAVAPVKLKFKSLEDFKKVDHDF